MPLLWKSDCTNVYDVEFVFVAVTLKPGKYGENPQYFTNRILASLPDTSPDLLKNLEPVELQSGMVLCEADEAIKHVYFLHNALVSLVSMNTEGSSVEIGLIGSEGLVGVGAILGGVSPFRAIVQMGGPAHRIAGQKIYEEFRKNPFLRDLLLKYTNALLIQIAQSTICNCYHSLQERLCRWLLIARDALQSDVVLMTHDVIARLLGTRRASVTVAAGLLQRAGLIKIRRGQIAILDVAGLNGLACECYQIVREGVRRVQSS